MRYQKTASVSRDMETAWFASPYEIESKELANQYRHINHTQQIAYLEKGRLDFLDEKGFGEDWWLQRHILLVVTEVTVHYLREVKASPLFVTVDSVSFENKEIVVTQRLFTSARRLAAYAEVRSACLHKEKKRAIEAPALFVASIEELAV
jgi:YbgC/YbaW family acyl-CoA thioester hydrolase